MAANVESMFYTRTAPWHGLGVRVEEVLGSKEALIQAGLDWKVEQTDVYHCKCGSTKGRAIKL